MIEKHFSPRELSEAYGIRETTLAQWRLRDKKDPCRPARGPKFVKFGRLVRYPAASVSAWLAQREHSATPAAN